MSRPPFGDEWYPSIAAFLAADEELRDAPPLPATKAGRCSRCRRNAVAVRADGELLTTCCGERLIEDGT